MQQIKIEIVTDKGENILQSLLEKDFCEIVSGNRSILLEDGSKIELSDDYAPGESFGLYEAIPIVLTFISGVVSQILASWIYDKLKDSDKHAKITYRGRTIPIDDLGDLIKDLNHALQFATLHEKQKKKRK